MYDPIHEARNRRTAMTDAIDAWYELHEQLELRENQFDNILMEIQDEMAEIEYYLNEEGYDVESLGLV